MGFDTDLLIRAVVEERDNAVQFKHDLTAKLEHRAISGETDSADRELVSDCLYILLTRHMERLAVAQADATRLREACEHALTYIQGWDGVNVDFGVQGKECRSVKATLKQALAGKEAGGVQVYGPGDETTEAGR